MDTLSYKTVSANKATVNKEWVVIDAEDQVLGRLATVAASMIRGKNKVNYTPHVDCGDNVIVVNAEKIKLTGNKWSNKEYVWYTGHPGGQKSENAQKRMAKNQTWMVENAVRGMLPKNRLGRVLIKNLYVYAGPEHPHAAQNPKVVEL